MSFSEWKKYKLGDIADIVMGQSPSGDTCNEIGNGIPLLNGPTEFTEHSPVAIQFSINPRKISEIGDLLFCVRGSTTGRMNWSDKEYAIGRGLASIRHKKGKEFQPFLRGLVEFNLNNILLQATGSTFPNVSSHQLLNLEVLIPDSKIQKRIASILSSLDDKIELNRQTNQTLEAMAQTLFKEMCLPLRDEIPDRWRIGKFKDVATQVKENIKPSKFSQKLFHHYSLPAFDNGEFPSYDLSETILSNKTAVRKYSVLFSKLNPRIPRIWSIGDVDELASICSTEFIGFVPKKDFQYSFINFFLKDNDIIKKLAGHATGTSNSHQRIQPKGILNLELIIPTDKILKQFDKIVRPLLEIKFTNIQQNQTLVTIRNSLLPKLMNREINIEAL